MRIMRDQAAAVDGLFLDSRISRVPEYSASIYQKRERWCSMRFLTWFALPILILFAPSLWANSITINFEGLPEFTPVTTQYPGVVFSNAIVLTAGSSLNEFEFPPHSGSNVISDNGGAMSIMLTASATAFSGFFTYLAPLT